jgi:hypothetical protein
LSNTLSLHDALPIYPDWPSYAAPLTHTKATLPPLIVADADGSNRSMPGFEPVLVTCRCSAAARPRVTAAQNVFTVGGAAVAFGVAPAAGDAEREGTGVPTAEDRAGDGSDAAVEGGLMAARFGPELHATAVSASSRMPPPKRERVPIDRMARNMSDRS